MSRMLQKCSRLINISLHCASTVTRVFYNSLSLAFAYGRSLVHRDWSSSSRKTSYNFDEYQMQNNHSSDDGRSVESSPGSGKKAARTICHPPRATGATGFQKPLILESLNALRLSRQRATEI